MTICIVDDTPSQRLMLAAVLKASGYEALQFAASAAEAFALIGLSAPAAGPPVDLILMDIGMPEIDGIEACRRIKAAEHLRDLPVIMVTASPEIEDLQLAFAAGAMDYITKPISKIELLARVRSALRLKHEMERRKAHERELFQVSQQLRAANQILASREHDLRLMTVQLQHLNQRLEAQTAIDGLTGIANRRKFDMVLNLQWQLAARTATGLGLLMIDIDHFKAYNDAYGHQGGDECLKLVARALAQALEPREGLIARYGGEEFVAVLPEAAADSVSAVAERLHGVLRELAVSHRASPVAPLLTISIGGALGHPGAEHHAADLLAAADQALYQAKQGGRNRTVIVQPALSDVAC